MNVNKRFQKLQQWGKDKMGSDGRNVPSDDSKALETEMNMRQSGMEKMHTSMHAYVKSLNKRGEGLGGEKATPISHLGSAMSRHGEDFEDGNKFGECLMGLGQANERMSRFQDTYATNATGSWLESLERSLAQMKEYQNARKKLEARRTAYDNCTAKMQKAKTADFRAEEELRTCKIKYEESAEDVNRRMQDIVESEQDTTQALYAFLEAELSYHDRCREVLMQTWKNWPAVVDPESLPRPSRSRNNTLSRIPTNKSIVEEEDTELAPPMPSFRGGQRAMSASSSPLHGTPVKEAPGFDFSTRPSYGRSNTNTEPVSRTASRQGSFDPSSIRSALPLRPMKQRSAATNADVFVDQEDEYTSEAVTRSSSPATSVSQGNISRSTSYSTLDGMPVSGAQKKKAPPPPPPSRGTKPPPPPPPMKRSALSSSTVPMN